MKHPIWTDDEKNYLRTNYRKLGVEEIVKHLGKSKKAIHKKASNMKLAKKYKTKKEKQIIGTKQRLQAKKINIPANRRVFTTIPFSSAGKRAVRIDAKTHVYVPANATMDEVNEIVSRYKKPA